MSEQRNLAYKEVRNTYLRYFELWKSRSILSVCREFRPKQVQKAIEKGMKNEG